MAKVKISQSSTRKSLISKFTRVTWQGSGSPQGLKIQNVVSFHRKGFHYSLILHRHHYILLLFFLSPMDLAPSSLPTLAMLLLPPKLSSLLLSCHVCSLTLGFLHLPLPPIGALSTSTQAHMHISSLQCEFFHFSRLATHGSLLPAWMSGPKDPKPEHS